VVVERIEVAFEKQNEVLFRLRRLPDEMLGMIPITVPGSRVQPDRPAGPPPPGRFAIRCSRFRGLTCPRLEPWGRSRQHAYINEARLGAGDSTRRLVLQLTSGDEIEVEAENIECLSD
jgi:hypothetical protein